MQLVHTLLEHGLVDELRLMVFPTVLGSEKKMFSESDNPVPVQLTDSKQAGETVVLVYEPRASTSAA
jgi:dihydrofolate reductase